MHGLMLWLAISIAPARADSAVDPRTAVETLLGDEPESFGMRKPSAVEEQRVEETLRAPGIAVEVAPTYFIESYNLLGSGLAARLPGVSSVGGEFRMSGVGWHLSGAGQSTNFASLPSTVTPSSMSAFSWNVETAFRVVSGWGQELRVGYGAFARSSGTTEPASLVSSFVAHGPMFSLSPVKKWALGRWVLGYALESTVPWFYAEGGSLTGTYRFGTRSRLKVSVSTRVWKGLELGVGLEALVQALFFAGSGARGTVDATDLELAVGLPLVVRYAF